MLTAPDSSGHIIIDQPTAYLIVEIFQREGRISQFYQTIFGLRGPVSKSETGKLEWHVTHLLYESTQYPAKVSFSDNSFSM